MLSLVAAAVLLASTADVANGLRNLAQMHTVVDAIELRRNVDGAIPEGVPPDPWGTPYRIDGGRVVSAGSDRTFEASPAAGQFEGTEGDIVFANGTLVRSNRNWLYAHVEPGTDSAAALEDLRRNEMAFMMMRTPSTRDFMLAIITTGWMRAGAKVDAWGTPLRFDGTRAISAGADRQFDPMSWGRRAAADLGEDIVVENGQVTRAVDADGYLQAHPPYVDPIPQPVDVPLTGETRHRRVNKAEGILPPRILSRVEPRYWESYRRARISGIVIVEAMISDQGLVESVRLLKSRAPELDAAAMEAVRQWTFAPGRLDGKSVPVIFNLTVNFTLK